MTTPTPRTDSLDESLRVRAEVMLRNRQPASEIVKMCSEAMFNHARQLEQELNSWKAAHDNQVNLRRALMDRPDLKERAILVMKLQQERDEARELVRLLEDNPETYEDLLKERDQLRKIADETKTAILLVLESANNITEACERLRPVLLSINQLTHVKQKETK